MNKVFQVAKSFAVWVNGKCVVSSEDQKWERLSICELCVFNNHQGRCIHCGCFLEPKTAMATESCPIGKW